MLLTEVGGVQRARHQEVLSSMAIPNNSRFILWIMMEVLSICSRHWFREMAQLRWLLHQATLMTYTLEKREALLSHLLPSGLTSSELINREVGGNSKPFLTATSIPTCKRAERQAPCLRTFAPLQHPWCLLKLSKSMNLPPCSFLRISIRESQGAPTRETHQAIRLKLLTQWCIITWCRTTRIAW